MAEVKKEQQKLDRILNNKLSVIPLRLIDTTSGKLCSVWELGPLFEQSKGYKNITAKISSPLESDIEMAVDQFFSYAMFSHRWGADADEPTYQHIKDVASIYHLNAPPGILKLQQFCRIACENHFRWAWSDTCCIDKSNNVELQESIISMFSWYRLSSTTIVYLADVMDEGSFRQSDWFTRGWTLQELIAPRLIWFYKKDWTPYIDSKMNHKGEDQVADIISEITSIDRKVLNDFVPGLRQLGPGEVKKRMTWLALRRTTKMEDMAYCMMGTSRHFVRPGECLKFLFTGIFGIHMPIMYGEKNHAFARLQKEIMNITDDVSLFDWVGEPSDLHSYFASHPRCFTRLPADYKSRLKKKPDLRLFTEPFKGLSDALKDTAIQSAKNILLDPPHGYFIANGRMNMRLFVHEVKKLTHVETTYLPTADDRLSVYKVVAEDLAEITVSTRSLLPPLSCDRDSPSYRLVRMWEVSLIPQDKAGGGGSEEHYDVLRIDGLSPNFPSKPKGLWSGPLDTVMEVLTFLSRLQEPFIAQLLVQKRPGMPYERVGTEERLIAQPYSGSFNLRGMKTVIVR